VSDKNAETRTPVSFTTATADDPRMQPLARHPERAERWIALSLIVGVLSTIGFGVAYWFNADPWVYGVTMGVGVTLLGVGITAWGKYLMPRGPFVEQRHEMRSTDAEREAFDAAVVQRGGGILGRRKLLGGIAGAGLGAFAIVSLFPLVRSLGPLPGKTLDKTNWKKGSYLTDSTGRPIHVDDVAVGGIVTVFPDGNANTDEGQAVDQTVLIRITTTNFTTRPGRESWGPSGYVAYSKLCTHLGCPVGLYEQELQLLVCPCHQSMFNVANGCEPEFGPAPRPLPQLPLYVDGRGYIRSQTGFDQPVGPGFWERS